MKLWACLPYLSAALLLGQTGSDNELQLNTGKEIWEAGCVACHGPDGKGMPETTVGFKKPDSFPDFTKCDQTTPELNSAYKSTIVYGGPKRGFSQIMPAFGELLTSGQIDKVVEYIRTFCKEPGWPRGELNLPLAQLTEKAYPEDEAVITSAANVRGAPGIVNTIIHEERFGVKNQLEVAIPIEFQHPERTWYGGFGDVTVGWKRVLYSQLRRQWGSILSLQGEVTLPTGSLRRGTGTGVTSFGTFGMFDVLMPGTTFIQIQSGAVLPTDTAKAPQNVYANVAVGKSISQSHGLGRTWSPMFEFVASRDLMRGATTDWDVAPEMQVTLSRRQHVRANLGVRIPVTNTADRPIQALFYILWDWQDGKLLEGW